MTHFPTHPPIRFLFGPSFDLCASGTYPPQPPLRPMEPMLRKKEAISIKAPQWAPSRSSRDLTPAVLSSEVGRMQQRRGGTASPANPSQDSDRLILHAKDRALRTDRAAYAFTVRAQKQLVASGGARGRRLSKRCAPQPYPPRGTRPSFSKTVRSTQANGTNPASPYTTNAKHAEKTPSPETPITAHPSTPPRRFPSLPPG